MAHKDERPGLLSKVAMFVRNPTKDWSELNPPDSRPDSAHDKLALKAMIERKRQNDFVRKREFDHLRKLRNRDPAATASQSRPSFFQSSIASDPDGRATTLKKIDEIEAQMSRQWWRAKLDGGTVQGPLPSAVPDAAAPETRPAVRAFETAPLALPSAFKTTVPLGLGKRPAPSGSPVDEPPTEYAATGLGPDMLDLELGPRPPHSGPVTHISDAGELRFSTSDLFAIDIEDVETDPDLEEAAIRFANGNDAGAEAGLVQALASAKTPGGMAANWAAALLDLYRATGDQAKFDRAIVDYAPWWQGRLPVWDADLQGRAACGSAAAPDPLEGAAIPVLWSSPAVLDAHSMESLRATWSGQPAPWALDWRQLEAIAPEAMSHLGEFLRRVCDEPVGLRCAGGSALLDALRTVAPAGDRSVDPAWWHARLNALRAMGDLDAFELVALDYCVTYEVSPPAWELPRCDYAALSDAPSHAMELVGNISGIVSGNISGDVAGILSAIDAAPRGAGPIVVPCRRLVRIDFAAAGSILNWVAARQSEGRIVQFQDVNRLVAAFFNVVGIHEHARVMLRPL
ncbi:STAS domain-containing protein [Rhodoferax sp. OV413]|uniref:STAS domain-containing protein n=1 Tax=Rhodoferax sp. OV413 TaxID=1855285 RepID=UPI0025E8A9A9|nr:STAS domain-containing protein [Rhodoferax sp. OV413]